MVHVEVEIVSTEEIIAACVVSILGLSIFVFGKRQQRVPQLVVGMLMMASPMVVRDTVWASLTALGLLLGLCVAVRYLD